MKDHNYVIKIYTGGSGTWVEWRVTTYDIDQNGIVTAVKPDGKVLKFKALNWSIDEV